MLRQFLDVDFANLVNMHEVIHCRCPAQEGCLSVINPVSHIWTAQLPKIDAADPKAPNVWVRLRENKASVEPAAQNPDRVACIRGDVDPSVLAREPIAGCPETLNATSQGCAELRRQARGRTPNAANVLQRFRPSPNQLPTEVEHRERPKHAKPMLPALHVGDPQDLGGAEVAKEKHAMQPLPNVDALDAVLPEGKVIEVQIASDLLGWVERAVTKPGPRSRHTLPVRKANVAIRCLLRGRGKDRNCLTLEVENKFLAAQQDGDEIEGERATVPPDAIPVIVAVVPESVKNVLTKRGPEETRLPPLRCRWKRTQFAFPRYQTWLGPVQAVYRIVCWLFNGSTWIRFKHWTMNRFQM